MELWLALIYITVMCFLIVLFTRKSRKEDVGSEIDGNWFIAYTKNNATEVYTAHIHYKSKVKFTLRHTNYLELQKQVEKYKETYP